MLKKRPSQYSSIDQPTFKLLEDRVAQFKKLTQIIVCQKRRRSAKLRLRKSI
jgi:hypothetical protein